MQKVRHDWATHTHTHTHTTSVKQRGKFFFQLFYFLVRNTALGFPMLTNWKLPKTVPMQHFNHSVLFHITHLHQPLNKYLVFFFFKQGLQNHLKKCGGKYNQILAFRPTGWTHSNKLTSLADIIPQTKGNISIYGIFILLLLLIFGISLHFF